MTAPSFFQTRIGQRFYEATMPKIPDQLERLNANLEALLAEHRSLPCFTRSVASGNNLSEVLLPKGTSHRLESAALHKLAADVELASRERWIAQTSTTPAAAPRFRRPTRRPPRPSGGWRCS